MVESQSNRNERTDLGSWDLQREVLCGACKREFRRTVCNGMICSARHLSSVNRAEPQTKAWSEVVPLWNISKIESITPSSLLVASAIKVRCRCSPSIGEASRGSRRAVAGQASQAADFSTSRLEATRRQTLAEWETSDVNARAC